MKPYFDDKEAVKRLRAAAQEWLGTPFSPRQAAKGMGVDCIQLAHQLVCVAAGFDYDFQPGTYSMQETLHATESRLLATLQAAPQFQFLEKTATPMAGDLPLITIGKAPHHIGVMLDGRSFVHAFQRVGVITSQLDDSTYSTRLHCFFRPIVA